MSDLESLYREIIMDHNRSPRNKGELETPPAHKAEGFNPLCGDEIIVYLQLAKGEDGQEVIEDIRIGGQGCSISQSSASMMSVLVKGKTAEEAQHLMGRFKNMLTIDIGDGVPTEGPTPEDIRALGDVAALQGVMQFPTRIKCATLSWNTLDQAFAEAAAES